MRALNNGSSDTDDDKGGRRSKSPKKERKPKVGDKCTAQFKGKGKFYPGKISRVNSDGTVNVDFDDGDKDRYVNMKSVKLEESSDTEDDRGRGRSRNRSRSRSTSRSRSSSSSSDFEKGDKIEARYKGKSKYYPGKIARVKVSIDEKLSSEDVTDPLSNTILTP